MVCILVFYFLKLFLTVSIIASANFIITSSKIPTMADITLEKLARDIEQLRKRIEYLESQILTKQDIMEIEDFLRRKERGELELLSFDEALKEPGIDESEIRKEISKETE